MELDQSKLKSVLDYDQESGVFVWKIGPNRSIKAGTVAGRIDRLGYTRVQINGKSYLSHRLAWLFVFGEMPSMHIDHTDGNPRNNAISNLRLATSVQNMQNTRKPYAHARSGLLGAAWNNSKQKWSSAITVGGKRKHLGTFKTKEEAHAKYIEAKRIYHEFCTV